MRTAEFQRKVVEALERIECAQADIQTELSRHETTARTFFERYL